MKKKYPPSVVQVQNGVMVDEDLKYTGGSYYNRFGTWTGVVHEVLDGYTINIVRRSGYETEHDADGYVDRWLTKLANKEMLKLNAKFAQANPSSRR